LAYIFMLFYCVVCFVYFFFFQAEDGIRDKLVTGVQTCALPIWSGGADPTVLRSNYGTLPNNRTHIFNLAYVYEFPTLHSANRFLKGAANGWQISGITQYQSGVDLQAAVAGNGNFNFTGYIPAGTTFMGQTLAYTDPNTGQVVLGSPDIQLMPTLICDPRQGLKANQYINTACFSQSV